MSPSLNVNRRQTGRPVDGARRVIPGGRIVPRDTPARLRAANEDKPVQTEGDAAIHAESLSLERFADWARYPRIELRFEGLGDRQGTLCWEEGHALGVGHARQPAFISHNDGRYQVPSGILCDRLAVPDVTEASFVAAMVDY